MGVLDADPIRGPSGFFGGALTWSGNLLARPCSPRRPRLSLPGGAGKARRCPRRASRSGRACGPGRLRRTTADGLGRLLTVVAFGGALLLLARDEGPSSGMAGLGQADLGPRLRRSSAGFPRLRRRRTRPPGYAAAPRGGQGQQGRAPPGAGGFHRLRARPWSGPCRTAGRARRAGAPSRSRRPAPTRRTSGAASLSGRRSAPCASGAGRSSPTSAGRRPPPTGLPGTPGRGDHYPTARILQSHEPLALRSSAAPPT